MTEKRLARLIRLRQAHVDKRLAELQARAREEQALSEHRLAVEAEYREAASRDRNMDTSEAMRIAHDHLRGLSQSADHIAERESQAHIATERAEAVCVEARADLKKLERWQERYSERMRQAEARHEQKAADEFGARRGRREG